MSRLLLASGVLALTSCSDDPTTLDWTILFASDELRARAVLVEAQITDGACDAGGRTRYHAEIRPGDSAAPRPDVLQSGMWAFGASARSADCASIATGCTAAELPGVHEVETLLDESAGEPACAPEQCHDGVCGEGDCTGAAATLCDGRCVDVRSDPENCGDCGIDCGVLHRQATCVDSVCEANGCAPGWGDCNDDDVDGCETDLHTVTDCGGCAEPCSMPNAVASCASGTCEVDDCYLAFEDCDGDPEDGCEADLLAPETCGSCDVACEGETNLCGRGGAGFTCLAGCPGDAPTVCDRRCVDLSTDPAHCGACGVSCSVPNGVGACVGGTCRFEACNPGWGDCDEDADDGCETPLSTSTDCGACDEPCALPNAVATCASGTCEVQSCPPGRGDCDGDASNGCEDPLTAVPNCGRCRRDCDFDDTVAACVDSACAVVSCEGDAQDCDGRGTNGCEADLRRDDDDCGQCGLECPGEYDCRDFVCVPD